MVFLLLNSKNYIYLYNFPSSYIQGEFEILSLSGSFTHDKMDGKKRVMGMLSISLAKPNGQVFGGAVGGPLIVATTPIQVRP